MIQSLKKRGDFLKVKEAGKKFVTKHFLVNFLEHSKVQSNNFGLLLGISITKKIDKRSARRNRLRRRIKEVVRALCVASPKAGEIVVVGRVASTEVDFDVIHRELKKCLHELKVI